MAHFYASIQGDRSERTCCGNSGSGIRCHIRGWNRGVRVVLRHDHHTGEDMIEVTLTGGSINPNVKSYVYSDIRRKQRNQRNNQRRKDRMAFRKLLQEQAEGTRAITLTDE